MKFEKNRQRALEYVAAALACVIVLLLLWIIKIDLYGAP